jgi:Flp pilus assembly protein CpaB
VKKKSPPYAIIGAVIFGILAIFLFIQHESAAQAANQKQLDDLKAQLAAAESAPKSGPAPPPLTVQQTDERLVYFATQPIDAGTRISPTFYEKKLTPNNILPDAYTDATDIVGWLATRKIEKGDPLTPRNIGKSLPYLSQRITPGMRSITLEVFDRAYNNTGNFIVDGDKVDLLYTTMTLDNFLIKTQLVLQNVKVLYVPGQQIKNEQTDGINPAGPGTIAVTFEVTPEEAQALVFMADVKNAKFSMILRAHNDTSEIKIKPFAAEDFAGNFDKVQRLVDKSETRVQELQQKIEAEEKTQGQGNTNETPNPTPPSP